MSAVGANGSSGLKELRQRLLFVLLALVVFRLGAHIPVPGIDPARLATFFNNQESGVLGYFNTFSGGALKQMTVFALGVLPYITASIIMQLMSSISPALEQLKKEGEAGRRKINQYTRYLALFFALFQSLGACKLLAASGVVTNPTLHFYLISTITFTTGAMFLMWLGEQMTERGVGNGVSLIIFAGIVSGLPSAVAKTFEAARQGQMSVIMLMAVVAVVIFVTGFVVFVERGQRRITINYAKRQQGRKIYAAQTSHLPLKLNMSGVIPPIFASSILMVPAFLAESFGKTQHFSFLSKLGFALGPGQPLYLVLYSVAIVFFAFFYTAIVFNPKDTADNLKKSGAFIAGIRPGEQTANYIDSVMTRLTVSGAIYLLLVALLPQFLIMAAGVPFYFGGTSLLIIVVVLMDFMAQVQAHLMSQQYESLLKKANLKGTGSNMGLIR